MLLAGVPADRAATYGRCAWSATEAVRSASHDLEVSLPCRTEDAELWFAERPEQLGRAQALCRSCAVRQRCLAAALGRREPWGVWGGEIFQHGRIIPCKRGRGRPPKVRIAPLGAGVPKT
jgi:WhiB family redox-sensing transcriptional regulator